MSEDRGELCGILTNYLVSLCFIYLMFLIQTETIQFTRLFIKWDNMFINFVRQEELCKCLSILVTILSAEGFIGRNHDF